MSRKKISLDRAPLWASTETLAAEMDVPPSKIQQLVQLGIIPRPIDLGNGVFRHDMRAIREALDSRMAAAALSEDPYAAGARNATAAR
jgi:hypothetical protein